MSQPVRIFLQLLGALLFVGGAVAIAAIVVIGPPDVGRLMGETCKTATDKVGEASHCYWRDVLGILRGLPWAVLFGAILLVVGRPERTPDRPARGGWLRTAGAAVVVLVVAVTMVGTPIYATAWSAVHQYKIAKEIFETPRPDIARPAAGR